MILNPTRTATEEGEKYEDQLQILKHIMNVHSRINDEITSDYTLAYLKDYDKQYVLDMYKNALFAKMCALKMIESLRTQIRQGELQIPWNHKTKDENCTCDLCQTAKSIANKSEEVFDAYMNEILNTDITNEYRKSLT